MVGKGIMCGLVDVLNFGLEAWCVVDEIEGNREGSRIHAGKLDEAGITDCSRDIFERADRIPESLLTHVLPACTVTFYGRAVRSARAYSCDCVHVGDMGGFGEFERLSYSPLPEQVHVTDGGAAWRLRVDRSMVTLYPDEVALLRKVGFVVS